MKSPYFFQSNSITIILIIASLLCLYLGLTEPIMSLKAGANLPIVGDVEFYNKTQSIWNGIMTLYETGYSFVGFLIFLFSVAVPVFKLLALSAVLIFSQWKYRTALHQFVLIIGKWSMADVFVVGIFIAFLAGQANPNMSAALHEGFYWFLAYCMISILSSQVLRLRVKNVHI